MADRRELLGRLFARCKRVHNELIRVEGVSLLSDAMEALGLEALQVESGDLTRALGPYLFFAAPRSVVGSSFSWRLKQGSSVQERALLEDLRDRAIFGAWEVRIEDGVAWAVGVPPVDEGQAEPARLARALGPELEALTAPGLYAGLLLPMNVASQRGTPPGDDVGPWLIFGRKISGSNADALRGFAARRGWACPGRFDAYEYACDVLIASVRDDAPRSSWSDLLFAREGAGRQLDTYVRATMLRMAREEGLAHPAMGRVHWSVALSGAEEEAELIAIATDLCDRLRDWNSRYYYGRDNRLAGVDQEVRRRLREWVGAFEVEGQTGESDERGKGEERGEFDEWKTSRVASEVHLGALPIDELPIDPDLLARAGAPTRGPLTTLMSWLDARSGSEQAAEIAEALRAFRWRLRWRRAFGEAGVGALQQRLFGSSYREGTPDFAALRDAVQIFFREVGARPIASLPWSKKGSRSRMIKGLGRGDDASVEQLFEDVKDPAVLAGVGASTVDDFSEALRAAVFEVDRSLVARFGAEASASRREAASGLDELEAFFDD